MLIKKTCNELAEILGGDVVGCCDVELTGVASLKEAMSTDVSFLGNEKYRSQVLPSKAGVVLVPKDFDEEVPAGRAWIRCEDPSASFSQVVVLFTPPAVTYAPGIADSAVVDSSAEIGQGVHIGANVCIGAGVKIGANTVILPGTVILENVTIGEGCLLYPNVTIRERCVLGNRVILHPGVVIGADGFGYDSGPTGHTKVPQVGIVQLDDDVEVGANSTIDRARFGRTWIQQGTKVDNLVQIGHNVVVGPCCLVVAQVGISGSTVLGQGVILAGQAGLAGHLTIGDGSIVMAQSGISKDLAPRSIVMGSPAMDRRQFAKREMYIKRLEELTAEIKELKEKLG